MKEFTEQVGWKTVAEQLAPLGTTDFSSYLLNIANSGADVFVNVAFGADATSSTKQAEQFGILSKMKYVVPNISQFQAKELGADDHGRHLRHPGLVVDRTGQLSAGQILRRGIREEEQLQAATGARARVYIQMLVWADAVERAGTFYPIDVIKALESGHKVPSIYGEVYYRAGDHQMVRPVPVMVGKKPDEMKGPDDFFRSSDWCRANRCCRRSAETGCKMPDINA